MQKEMLLRQLMALDFMSVDLQLYLDTHPYDREAISEYNNIIKEADLVRMKYEKNFGPLCSFRSLSSDDKFEWINDPWPWQSKFNTHYDRGER